MGYFEDIKNKKRRKNIKKLKEILKRLNLSFRILRIIIRVRNVPNTIKIKKTDLNQSYC